MRGSLRNSDLTESRRWRAVLARDTRYDQSFVYAVRSTGIFCRPSCPSRKPRRTQVLFYPLPLAAERAGFRPCRRCKPTGGAVDPRTAVVRRACEIIDASTGEHLTLGELAGRVAATPDGLARAFRALLGVSPRQYDDQCRLERFKTRLKERKTVSPALYDAGYSSTSRVYERAHAQLGMTPATYLRGGRGMRIRFATATTSLGHVLVAATERGICRVSIGENPAVLERALRREFPAAHVAPDRAALRPWLDALAGQLDRGTAATDLPLDIRATAFQRRVWEALRKIPAGRTRSYTEIARAIGRPRATRAVARACATNPVALVIPCHRVVRADGDLGGYRWGAERKRKLIEREAAAIV